MEVPTLQKKKNRKCTQNVSLEWFTVNYMYIRVYLCVRVYMYMKEKPKCLTTDG